VILGDADAIARSCLHTAAEHADYLTERTA